MRGSFQLPDALDGQEIRAHAADLGAHSVKHLAELLQVRFTGGIVNGSGALGEHRSRVPMLDIVTLGAGGRLALLPDGQLLVTVGGFGPESEATEDAPAQDPGSSYGKTILVDLESGASRIFTMGHRNPQGLAFDGSDIWPLLSGRKNELEREALLYFDNVHVQCARLGRYKLHVLLRGDHELYLQGFAHTVAVMQTAENIERVAAECAEDLAADGVVYAEVRYAPELSTERGLSLDEVVEANLEGFRIGMDRAAAAGDPVRRQFHDDVATRQHLLSQRWPRASDAPT